MKRAMLVVLLAAGSGRAEPTPPTDRELHCLPTEAAGRPVTSALIFGEPVGKPMWPIEANYGNKYAPKEATIQCFAEEKLDTSCTSKGDRKVQVAELPGCYTPPDKEGGALVMWNDGKWNCSLALARALFVASERKAEQAAAMKHATDAAAAIRACRDGASDASRAATIEAVRVRRRR